MGFGGTCWYLCGLFAVTAALMSFVTFAPGHEVANVATFAVLMSASLLFAGAAMICQRRVIRGPTWALGVLQCVAALFTLVLLFGVIG